MCRVDCAGIAQQLVRIGFVILYKLQKLSNFSGVFYVIDFYLLLNVRIFCLHEAIMLVLATNHWTLKAENSKSNLFAYVI